MRRPTRFVQLSALVAVCLCVFVPPVCAQECPEFVGRLPGEAVSAIASEGDFVYFGSGNMGARYGVTELW